jgi:hypothetical protein
MIQKLLNRLILIFLLAVSPTAYFLNQKTITIENWTDYLMIALLIISFIWLLIEIKEYLDFQKRKKEIVFSPNLIKGIDSNKSENYFNLKIKSNDKEFQIFEDNELKIYLDKQNNRIEIFNLFGKKEYSLNELDFVVFEFLSTYLFTPKHDWGKIKWYCNFLIKLKKSDKLIPIVELVSDRDNLKEMYDYKEMDTNEFYYSKGLEISNILSVELQKKYAVLNHLTRKMNKNK